MSVFAAGNIKKKNKNAIHTTSALMGIASLFSSRGDSDSELRNPFTQLTEFSLAGCYHASLTLTLQITHGLLGILALVANPCSAAIPASLEPSRVAK